MHTTDSFASYRDGVLHWRLLQQRVGWHEEAGHIAKWAWLIREPDPADSGGLLGTALPSPGYVPLAR